MFHRGFKHSKTIKALGRCFHQFSRVWNPDETLALVFEILLNKLSSYLSMCHALWKNRVLFSKPSSLSSWGQASRYMFKNDFYLMKVKTLIFFFFFSFLWRHLKTKNTVPQPANNILNGGFCVCYTSNIFRNVRGFQNLGVLNNYPATSRGISSDT